jgi:L-threonylcarbamoyladenylate synthase
LEDGIDTQVVQVAPDTPDPHTIQLAAARLRQGGLVAFPTETVYGLGANALDAAAVARIFQAKGRPASDPLIVHIVALVQLDDVARTVTEVGWQLAQRFWPGPLTLVLQRHAQVPALVSAGLDTVAVRMPRHPVAAALLRAARVPVAAPSANLFARPSPTTAHHVLEDLQGRIDLVIDSGPTLIGLESTVVDVTRTPPAVLRPGGVTIEALRESIPDLQFEPQHLSLEAAMATAGSPGMLARHYSPRAELLLFTGPLEPVLASMRTTAQQRSSTQIVGILVPDEERAHFEETVAQVVSLGSRDDLDQIGRNLFAGIRALDQLGVEVILVRGVARTGLGTAIWDRLFRATEGRVITVGDV